MFSPLQFGMALRSATDRQKPKVCGSGLTSPRCARSQPAPCWQRRESLMLFEPTSLEFWPTVDGHVMPAHPAELFEQGRVANCAAHHRQPTDEGTLFAFQHPVKTAAAWGEFARRAYPVGGDDLLARYPAVSDAEVFTSVSRYITDWIFAGTTRGTARAMTRHNRRVWRYEFTRINPGASAVSPSAPRRVSQVGVVLRVRRIAVAGSAPESLRSQRSCARQGHERGLGAICQNRRPERWRTSIMASAHAN